VPRLGRQSSRAESYIVIFIGVHQIADRRFSRHILSARRIDSMRMFGVPLCAVVLTALLGLRFAAPVGIQARPQSASQDAAKIQNPVPAEEASIAAGKKLYADHCAECHGETGKGDGPRAPYATPTPPSLVDAEWKHGSTDGEIFTVIHDGVKDTDMAPFSEKMTTHQIWDAVNYLRSIGPAPAKQL
jgi:mono/diheme cytochrome c family protein